MTQNETESFLNIRKVNRIIQNILVIDVYVYSIIRSLLNKGILSKSRV